MSTNDFNLFEALSIEPVYDPPQRFLEPFYLFADRISSLQRYFEYTNTCVISYLKRSRQSLENLERGQATSAEEFDMHYEVTISDEEYFPDYLRGSVLSHVFTLLENLLVDVADEAAGILGAGVELPNKTMPYINKYMFYLQQTCGLAITIDKKTWKTIDALRELRNRDIHRLNRDLPDTIRQQLGDSLISGARFDVQINDGFVHEAFTVIGDLAHALDEAFWTFSDAQASPPTDST